MRELGIAMICEASYQDAERVSRVSVSREAFLEMCREFSHLRREPGQPFSRAMKKMILEEERRLKQ